MRITLSGWPGTVNQFEAVLKTTSDVAMTSVRRCRHANEETFLPAAHRTTDPPAKGLSDAGEQIVGLALFPEQTLINWRNSATCRSSLARKNGCESSKRHELSKTPVANRHLRKNNEVAQAVQIDSFADIAGSRISVVVPARLRRQDPMDTLHTPCWCCR